MALRKASAYSKMKARPYTRNSRSKMKAYIKKIPFSKIVKYTAGSQKDHANNKHKYELSLISEEQVQIRDNSLEACRMQLTKFLDTNIPGQYFLHVKVHPHHLLRENKAAAGAGADRISSGMTHSFGMVIGRAAMVKPGQEIFFVSCINEKNAMKAKEILNIVKSKVPCRSRVIFRKLD